MCSHVLRGGFVCFACFRGRRSQMGQIVLLAGRWGAAVCFLWQIQAPSFVSCNMRRTPLSRMSFEAVSVEGVSFKDALPSKLHISSLLPISVTLVLFELSLSFRGCLLRRRRLPRPHPFSRLPFSQLLLRGCFLGGYVLRCSRSRLLFLSTQLRSRLHSSTSTRLHPSSCFFEGAFFEVASFDASSF
jgi:hypothetical protein